MTFCVRWVLICSHVYFSENSNTFVSIVLFFVLVFSFFPILATSLKWWSSITQFIQIWLQTGYESLKFLKTFTFFATCWNPIEKFGKFSKKKIVEIWWLEDQNTHIFIHFEKIYIHQLATMDVMWEGNTFFIIFLSYLLIIHILTNNHIVWY